MGPQHPNPPSEESLFDLSQPSLLDSIGTQLNVIKNHHQNQIVHWSINCSKSGKENFVKATFFHDRFRSHNNPEDCNVHYTSQAAWNCSHKGTSWHTLFMEKCVQVQPVTSIFLTVLSR